MAFALCVGRESKAISDEVPQLQEQLAETQKKVLEYELAQQQIKALEAERDALQAEVAKQAPPKPEGASADQVKSLEKQRDALRQQVDAGVKAASQLEAERRKSLDVAAQLETEREKGSRAAAQVDEAQRKSKTLQDDLDALRKKTGEERQVKLRELENMRSQFSALQTDRDALKMEMEKGSVAAQQLQESQLEVRSLEEERDTLQKELAESRRQRRDSLTEVTRSLSEVSAKLGTAETSWTPWKEINDAKEKLGNIQDTVGDDSLLRGA